MRYLELIDHWEQLWWAAEELWQALRDGRWARQPHNKAVHRPSQRKLQGKSSVSFHVHWFTLFVCPYTLVVLPGQHHQLVIFCWLSWLQDDLTMDDWKLVMKLKKILSIPWVCWQSRRDPVSEEPPEATSPRGCGSAWQRECVHKLTRAVILFVAPFHTNTVFQFWWWWYGWSERWCA